MEAGSVPVIPDSHPAPGLQALSSLVTLSHVGGVKGPGVVTYYGL
jgi:hypothetical protein